LIVGACNPPTDKGRNPIPNRMLKHCCICYIDFPSYDSFVRIYSSFNKPMLKNILKQKSDDVVNLTKLQVDFYMECRKKYNTDLENHYI